MFDHQKKEVTARTATHSRLLVPSCSGGAVTGEVGRVMHAFGKIPSIKNIKPMLIALKAQ